jgi:hypothetical protein
MGISFSEAIMSDEELVEELVEIMLRREGTVEEPLLARYTMRIYELMQEYGIGPDVASVMLGQELDKEQKDRKSDFDDILRKMQKGQQPRLADQAIQIIQLMKDKSLSTEEALMELQAEIERRKPILEEMQRLAAIEAPDEATLKRMQEIIAEQSLIDNCTDPKILKTFKEIHEAQEPETD